MATDQEIREAGYYGIPQQQYLLNPFEIPTADPVTDQGIVATKAFTGNDGFSVYNPDPNSIVNRNYDPTRYNNLMENSFLYGGSNATEPKYLNQPFPGGLNSAQAAYDYATKGINLGYGDMIAKDDPNLKMYRGDKSVFQMQKDADDIIQDEKMRYATQGQYETVPSEFAYSSQTELDKFKDMYPEYFGLNQTGPKKGIPGIMEKYIQNSFLGKGLSAAGNILQEFLPTNRRSILENELSGKGIMVNDIGQIVQGEGAYDTAANVMAGYNASKMTAKTFDDRIAMAREKMSDENKGARIAALEAAKKDFLAAQGKADFVYDEEEAEKKRKGTIISRLFKNKKKDKPVDTSDDTSTNVVTVSGNNNQNDGGGYTKGKDQGQTGSWTPGGSYTAPAPKQRDYSQHHAYGLRRGGLVSIL
jgi:hypothetical protein|tara:strand:+ start:919 stop:2169 length:1251 start_codon:yes stop_codon:yes gene_type:complete